MMMVGKVLLVIWLCLNIIFKISFDISIDIKCFLLYNEIGINYKR